MIDSIYNGASLGECTETISQEWGCDHHAWLINFVPEHDILVGCILHPRNLEAEWRARELSGTHLQAFGILWDAMMPLQ